MADELQGQLKKFLSRSRKRRTGSNGLPTFPSASRADTSFQPAKQATRAAAFRPAKRNRKTTRI